MFDPDAEQIFMPFMLFSDFSLIPSTLRLVFSVPSSSCWIHFPCSLVAFQVSE